MSRPQPEEATYYSREEYHRWCAAQTGGRYERIDGRIVKMAAERARQVRVKYFVVRALKQSIKSAGVHCEAMGDGMTVETGDSDYEPDALVNCGPPIDGDSIIAPNPVIVVEVLSPSTIATDTGGKLVGYFLVPSVVHYLIVHPVKRSVIHHRRETSGGIATKILSGGELRLDPPGISVTVEDFYAED